MPRREEGFTLIEVLVVVAIIAIIASTAIPNLISSRMNANESAAIATLKNISSSQAQLQASVAIDVNANGQGEYGFFGELSGVTAVRGGAQSIRAPVLSAAFGNIGATAQTPSRVARSGYVFQVFLPDAATAGVAEDPTGGDVGNDNNVDPSQAEVMWCCYAWPQVVGNSGNRTFFVNQTGDVLATHAAVTTYNNAALVQPAFSAAYAASASAFMSSPVAANTVGHDGNIWGVVQ